MLNVELLCFVLFCFVSVPVTVLCFNIVSIVFKLTFRNYNIPSQQFIQKRIKAEVIQKDILSFRSGVIIVNYKYQGNVLLVLLNLSLGKRKWCIFPYYYQVQSLKIEEDRIFLHSMEKTLRNFKNNYYLNYIFLHRHT